MCNISNGNLLLNGKKLPYFQSQTQYFHELFIIGIISAEFK